MTLSNLMDLNLSMKIEFDEPLSKYTYTKTGGPADAVAFPETKEDLKTLINWVKDNQIPLTILGNASNLIVRDGGIRGLVIILTAMKEMSINGNEVYAQSGVPLIEVSRKAGASNLTGLEFACGIPGSIGGAVYMNAGAYGGEVVDVIESVDILTREGEFKTIQCKECEFSYRHSVFQTNEDIVIGVKFVLAQGDREAIHAKMAELTHLRESKQPLEYPSCGSVFKRPTGYFTGKLIQEAGLQGYRIGGAEVSKKHAGFIVNIDNATATDYVRLIEYIQEVIWRNNQVRLEPEVRIIGEAVEKIVQ
ncbi:UDP-N-acetylmuramate dehydrogenase [Globicatella sanguinis]|uniref:UDP-N-acetylmuramate dehydrogenase n=1 Tax=Globicatella sanguinis TaxID=13076 RepID=UPI000825AED4|nr:UDP-N-acetylmuramate dehydrogenase [Globicatella sanguinis]MDK7629918.1 UDP-N-acetylmuramate dehydrogenase [Globicatella sanguinis]WIK66346.1 UDP-N-acetylmuramate dehydrogenase [Globicatella sanguinis]WKT55751.1 UDP-N-acetylmuramate dehydrogenase [Globicatella sanguinis]